MKIQILTDSGQVIDSYEGVVHSDIESEAFGKPIHDWMWKTLKRGEEMQEPIVDDFSCDAQPRQRVRRIGEVSIPHDVSIHAADRTMEAEQRAEKSQDEIDNTVANVVVQVWNDEQEKWLDYSRDTWAGADKFFQTLMHSNSPTRKYRAIADFGDGEVLWSMKD